MAELLEKHLLYLRAKLEELKKNHANETKPDAIDIKIEALEQQIYNLVGFGPKEENYH